MIPKFYKKAQTATEYMIILAVVIIIALIAIGVLGGIPGIGGSASTRTSSAYWQTADIGIASHSVSTSSADVTLVVKNNMENSISLNDFKVSDSTTGEAIHSMNETEVPMRAGTEKTFTGVVNDTNGDSAICDTQGDDYTLNVKVNYSDSSTGATYIFDGDGNQLEGTCAN
ncbi:MAG: hypothetical protein ACQEP1_06505 [Nanobdellota archaeon]